MKERLSTLPWLMGPEVVIDRPSKAGLSSLFSGVRAPGVVEAVLLIDELSSLLAEGLAPLLFSRSEPPRVAHFRIVCIIWFVSLVSKDTHPSEPGYTTRDHQAIAWAVRAIIGVRVKPDSFSLSNLARRLESAHYRHSNIHRDYIVSSPCDRFKYFKPVFNTVTLCLYFSRILTASF